MPCEPGYEWNYEKTRNPNNSPNWEFENIRFFLNPDGSLDGYTCVKKPETGSGGLSIGIIVGIIGATLGLICCIALPFGLCTYRRNMLEKARISPEFATKLYNRASVDGVGGKGISAALGGLEAAPRVGKCVATPRWHPPTRRAQGSGLGLPVRALLHAPSLTCPCGRPGGVTDRQGAPGGARSQVGRNDNGLHRGSPQVRVASGLSAPQASRPECQSPLENAAFLQ